MRVKLVVLGIILFLVILGSFNVVVLAETKTNTTTPMKEITIIEKSVCFNVSITDVYNLTTTKTICVVVDFYIYNSKPSNETINVEFPLTITIGNRTIEKKVIVPLKVEGVVSKIIVKGVKEGVSGEENVENVIWVVPQEEKKTSTPVTTTPKPTSKTTTTTRPHAKTTTTPKPVVITKTVTKTVTPEQPSINVVDIVPYLLIIVVAVMGIMIWKMRRPKEKEEKREEKESIEDYIETLKLLKEKLEEKEQELEKEKKTPIKFRIKCPYCGNNISPTFLDDGRIICPICKHEIGRVKEDGSLELIPSKLRGENGILREGRNRTSKEKTRENEGGVGEEAGRGEQED